MALKDYGMWESYIDLEFQCHAIRMTYTFELQGSKVI